MWTIPIFFPFRAVGKGPAPGPAFFSESVLALWGAKISSARKKARADRYLFLCQIIRLMANACDRDRHGLSFFTMNHTRHIFLVFMALAAVCLLCGHAFADGEEIDFPKESPPPSAPWKVKEIIFKGFDNLSESEARAVMETKGAGSLGLEKSSVYDPVILARTK